jgi:hypothetical protein
MYLCATISNASSGQVCKYKEEVYVAFPVLINHKYKSLHFSHFAYMSMLGKINYDSDIIHISLVKAYTINCLLIQLL